jgi:hypothetical protein
MQTNMVKILMRPNLVEGYGRLELTKNPRRPFLALPLLLSRRAETSSASVETLGFFPNEVSAWLWMISDQIAASCLVYMSIDKSADPQERVFKYEDIRELSPSLSHEHTFRKNNGGGPLMAIHYMALKGLC